MSANALKVGVQSFGRFLSGIVMPNIGAFIVWGLSEGRSQAEALQRGIACGAATASQSGTTVGSLSQVQELLGKVVLSVL